MWTNMAVRHDKDGSIIRPMCFACQIIKVTDTHSEYVIRIAFYCNNGYAKATLSDFILCVRKVTVHLGYGT
jgi:hypothetical protein